MRTHSLPRFSLTVSGLLCRVTASRHIAGKVTGPSRLFSSGETVAAVAEDTLETISLDWTGGPGLTGAKREEQVTDYILCCERYNSANIPMTDHLAAPGSRARKEN
jgi:hypothetical protein